MRLPTFSDLRNRWLALFVRIGISAFLLFWILSRVSVHGTLERLSQTTLLPTFFSFLALGSSLLLSAIRWHGASGRMIPLSTSIRYTWISQVYVLILPGALSADVAKGVVMTAAREINCKTTLASSILLDRVAGLGSLVILALIANDITSGILPLPPQLSWILIGLVSILLLSVPLLIQLPVPPAKFPRIRTSLEELANRLDWRTWSGTLLLSFGIHLLNVFYYWFAFRAIGGAVDWTSMALYTCILNFALILPVSIAGVGIREQLALQFFGAGGESSLLIAFAWLALLLHGCHALIGVFLQLTLRRKSKATPS